MVRVHLILLQKCLNVSSSQETHVRNAFSFFPSFPLNLILFSDDSSDEQFTAVPLSPQVRVRRSTSATSMHNFPSLTPMNPQSAVVSWLNDVNDSSQSSKVHCIYCDRLCDTESEMRDHVHREHIEKSDENSGNNLAVNHKLSVKKIKIFQP